MNNHTTLSYLKYIHRDILNEFFDTKHPEELGYLSLCGLPIKPKVSLDEDTGSSLAYLQLAGMLTQMVLAPKFRTFFDIFIKLKLDDYLDLYQDIALRKYKMDREARTLEILVTTCQRFGRLKMIVQRKTIFNRIFDNLFETYSQDVSTLKKLVDILQETDASLGQLSVLSMNPQKLNYFFTQMKKCYPLQTVEPSVQDPISVLMNQDEWGPVHRCFIYATVSSLAVTLNHGFEQKISNRQLNWYLKSILTRKKQYYDENFPFWYNYFKEYDIHNKDYLFRRLFLTIQLLYVILHKMNTNHRRCLRLVWKTIPDHYITAIELELVTREMPVRKRMIKSYEAFLNSGKYNEVRNYINRPRDLKHYCRCRIRNSLIPNRELPRGIKALGLPKELQSYMLLESSGISTSFVLE